MQTAVKMQREGKHVNVSFDYNSDLVEIMRELKGWWVYKKMCWMFPVSRLSEIRDVLTSKWYKVKILPEIKVKLKVKPKKIPVKEKIPKKDTMEYFKDKDIVAVWNTCKKCGKESYVNNRKLCVRCA